MLLRMEFSVIGLCVAVGPWACCREVRGGEPAAPAHFVLETDHVRYMIGGNGRNLGFVDKRSGRDYCAESGQRPFITVKKRGVEQTPVSCRYANGRIVLRFQKPDVTAVLRATCKRHYIVFELESVSDPGVDEVRLSNLGVACSKYVGEMSGVASDDDFAACLRALNLQVQASVGGRPTLLASTCYRKYGLAGAKIALVGCPCDELRGVLKELVRDEGLLSSPLGGPWALEAEENRGSYAFADISDKNVDQWIALAKRAGITHLHLVGWERSLGHYQPREDLFAGGLTGLKRVVAKIHAAGLKAGMHTLTGCISPHDPWITPVPDRRLDTDAHFTLAGPMDAKSGSVPIVEIPGDFDTVFAYGSHGNVIRVDDELIAFGGLARRPPYGFTDCARGAFGTKAAAHAKGSAVDHLVVRWGQFHPDENSTLVDEVAETIARVYNECGFDMIYMDGITEDTMSGGWHAAAKVRAAIFRRLKGRVLVEASCWDYHSWPFHSRIGAWDHPLWALKRFVDVHCRLGQLDTDGRTTERHLKASLLPWQLGWWSILGPDRDHPAEFPDEIEYLCAKALGHDVPISFQGVYPGDKPWNARQEEYLDLIGRYERLRLGRYFPESIRARLRKEKEEFRLAQGPGGVWQLVPAEYAAHKVTGREDGSSRWFVENRFATQPLRLRIEALYSAEPYDAADSLVLTGFSDEHEFADRAAAPKVTHSLTPCQDRVKVGKVSGRYSATSAMASRQGAWCRASKSFSPPIDMERYGALGVWIYGDGKGEVLNLQLNNPLHYWPTYDEHYVKVDFTGWRYFELLLRERDAAEYGDYVWPYYDNYGIYRSPLIRGHVSALNLYFNNLPPQESVTCCLSPVRSLRTVKATLRNPAVAIGGHRVVFPVALESGSYLEMESASACRLYNDRGALVRRVAVQGDVPLLASGKNAVEFACEGPKGRTARAKVTVIACGEPLCTFAGGP